MQPRSIERYGCPFALCIHRELPIVYMRVQSLDVGPQRIGLQGTSDHFSEVRRTCVGIV